jgi:hypothetical protein
MNAFVDCLSLLDTKLRFEPFQRFAILFGIIAAAIAVTKRNDIVGDCTWTMVVGEGYPMVSGKSMPQSSGTPTGSTATFKVVKRELPILLSKVDGQGGNSGRAALANHLASAGIVSLPFESAPKNAVALLLIILAVSLPLCLNVAQGISAAIELGFVALLIGFYLLLNGFTVAEIVLVRVSAIARLVSLSPTALLCPITGFALRPQAVFVAAVAGEIFSRRGQFSFANRAAFSGVHRCNYTTLGSI